MNVKQRKVFNDARALARQATWLLTPDSSTNKMKGKELADYVNACAKDLYDAADMLTELATDKRLVSKAVHKAMKRFHVALKKTQGKDIPDGGSAPSGFCTCGALKSEPHCWPCPCLDR
jgi:hypothetical protein